MTKEINKSTAKESIEQWTGKGKVNITGIEKVEEDWVVRFKCKGGSQRVTFPNYQEAEEFSFVFGGKNNLTVAAPHSLLSLDGWDSEQIYTLGHIITKIETGKAYSNKDNKEEILNILPLDCGYSYLPGSKRKQPEKEAVTLKKTIEMSNILNGKSITFDNSTQFNNFKDYVEQNYPNHKIPIEKFVTQNHETGDFCKFTRKKVGDGTRRMELRLLTINNKDFTKCRYLDLIKAADGLAASECERVFIEKKDKRYEEHCGIHLGI